MHSYQETINLIHRQVQIISGIARYILGTDSGDTNARMLRDPVMQGFQSVMLNDDDVHITLDIIHSIIYVEKAHHTINSQYIIGMSPIDVLGWLQQTLNTVGIHKKLDLQAPFDHELDPMIVDRQSNFGAINEARDISHIYHMTYQVLSKRTNNTDHIATRPHHFDMAIILNPSRHQTSFESVSIGMSPGDQSIQQPYRYTTVRPYPPSVPKTILSHEGVWHQQGRTGSVLVSTPLIHQSGAQEGVQYFFEESIAGYQSI